MTYADTYPNFGHPERWKNDLKRFGRKWGDGSFVWRLEMTIRKSGVYEGEPRPHFHLLVYDINQNEFLQFRKLVHRSWFDITNTEEESHIRTKVERIRHKHGVQAYAAKGMSKVLAGEVGKMSQAYGCHIGRWRGVYFRGNVPWGAMFDTVLTEGQSKKMLLYFRKHAGLNGKDFHTLTVFLDTKHWIKCLPWLLYPDAYQHQPENLRSKIFSQTSKFQLCNFDKLFSLSSYGWISIT